MIRHAAHAIAFPIAVARNGGEIRVELRTNFGIQQRHAVLRAEDQMNEIQTEGLRHGGKRLTGAENGTGRWPSFFRVAGDPALRTGLVWDGPLARERVRRFHTREILNAPTVHPIPAWAIGPGNGPRKNRRANGPIYWVSAEAKCFDAGNDPIHSCPLPAPLPLRSPVRPHISSHLQKSSSSTSAVRTLTYA